MIHISALHVCLLISLSISQVLLATARKHDGSASFPLPAQRPLVIAHRGSSGTLPEHTLRAYEQAIADGADYIECDVTITKDLVPVCIHENWLDVTTDVAGRPEFADRKRNLTIFGQRMENWFAIDFTLVELKTLRKKQAMSFRDPTFDGLYDIPTFSEFLELARNHSNIGIYPEIKDPEALNSLDIMNGTRFEDLVMEVLAEYDYTDADDLCFVQSFSEPAIVYLSSRTHLPLVMLIQTDVTDAKLDAWRALNVAGIGTSIQLISKFNTPANGNKNWIRETTNIIERCHARGFKVHPWTLRNEDRYLAWDWRQDVHEAFDHFLELGADGLFTDFPKSLADHLDFLYATDETGSNPGSVGRNNVGLVWMAICLFSFLWRVIVGYN